MTFILTVVVGMVVVPLALYFANQGPGPLSVPPVHTASSAASASRTPTPSPNKSPTPSPSAKKT